VADAQYFGPDRTVTEDQADLVDPTQRRDQSTCET
jgi:hypothetical protein